MPGGCPEMAVCGQEKFCGVLVTLYNEQFQVVDEMSSPLYGE